MAQRFRQIRDMAHTRQSRPYFGLDLSHFKNESLWQPLQVLPLRPEEVSTLLLRENTKKKTRPPQGRTPLRNLSGTTKPHARPKSALFAFTLPGAVPFELDRSEEQVALCDLVQGLGFRGLGVKSLGLGVEGYGCRV